MKPTELNGDHERNLIESALRQESGLDIDVDSTASIRAPAKDPPRFGHRSINDSIGNARFSAGKILARRYRIVGLLGKGGMGEVYRADDLVLRQPVALKFLPEMVSNNPRRLERLQNEVRIARKVSHPNVCRVYDIDQAEGLHFLTMEYIDGEDLASLIRRVGHLPKEKAMQIAWQLCTGLTAVHQNGIVHRDLKPQNVMIDGRGQVRITDFGVAVHHAEASSGHESFRAGTPAYMSPEQHAGMEVSFKSDLFALGLVLYETFTGHKAAGNRADRFDSENTWSPKAPSSIVEDIDPNVEREILSCLEIDPRHRPHSALAIVSAIGRGDPLAAAQAAGDTPSPELVAVAGDLTGITRTFATVQVTTCLVGLAITLVLAQYTSFFALTELPKPPAVLVNKAVELVQQLGMTVPDKDTAYGFAITADHHLPVRNDGPTSADEGSLAESHMPHIYFWCRFSPDYMERVHTLGRVLLTDSAASAPGVITIHLEPDGRLITIEAMLWDNERNPEECRVSAPIWSILFVAAGLEFKDFERTSARTTPSVPHDKILAWEGPDLEGDTSDVRVDAATLQDQLIFFSTRHSTSRSSQEPDLSAGGAQSKYELLIMAITIILFCAGILLARRQYSRGRGDRRGAAKLALFYFVGFMLLWLTAADHVSRMLSEWMLFVRATGYALFWSSFVWLSYIALEPYIRRRWPELIVSWSRLLTGVYRDPLVGRDLQFGVLLGTGLLIIDQVAYLTSRWLGEISQIPYVGSLDTLLGTRYLIAETLSIQLGAVTYALGLLFIVVLIRMALDNKWVTVIVCYLLILASLMIFSADRHSIFLSLMFNGLQAAILILALLRYGLVTLTTCLFVAYMLSTFPVTMHFDAWHVNHGLFALMVCAGLAIFGYWAALAERPFMSSYLSYQRTH